MNYLRVTLLGLAVAASAAVLVALALLPRPRSSEALFHFAVIDEVMTSYGGDSSAQFVEIRMLADTQNFVMNTVLAVFNTSGVYQSDVLIVPGNVANSGAGVRWIMGTSAFATASGLTPDFIMPAGLPASGMVCWGALAGTSNPANHVDCLAYGGYTGPGNIHIGTPVAMPTPLNGIGHSLQRTQDSNSSLADFVCADPATPTNNVGGSASLPATTSCLPDADGDTVPDATDNCPSWPNTNQSQPPWTIPAGDADCDGWSSAGEGSIGTEPDLACSATGAVTHPGDPTKENDEPVDNWPADMNDDQVVNLSDVLYLAPPKFFSVGPGPPYGVRYDLNLDNAINLSDILYLAPPVFFAACTP